MDYLPKNNKRNLSLNDREQRISKSNDFFDFFKIIEFKEKIVYLEGQGFFYQYYFSFKKGIDKLPLFYLNVDELGNLHSAHCYICRLGSFCHHLNQGYDLIVAEYAKINRDSTWKEARLAQIEGLISQEKIRLKEEEVRKIRDKHLGVVQPLLNTLAAQDIQPLTIPVRLEPFIYIEKDLYHNDVLLELKVGIERMYVVRNLDIFLSNVIETKEHKYGKNLTFIHSLANFDERAQKLIEILIDQRSKTTRRDFLSYDKRITSLDFSILEDIFKIYKGQEINLTIAHTKIKGLYHLSLEAIEVGFKINDDYSIALLNLDDGYVLDCLDESFLIKDRKVYLLTFPQKKMRALYKFVRDNKDFSFKPIEDVLKKQILARYYDHFELAEKIKPNLEIKDFRIEACFDYEQEIIKLKTKYYYDNEEVDYSLIQNNGYLDLKVDQYNLVIKSLGVEENKIEDAGKIFQFLHFNLDNLKSHAEVYLSERLAKLQAKRYQPMAMNLTYDTGMLAICFEESEYSNEELAKIIKGLRKKVKYIKLKNNVILEISEEDAETILNTIEEFNLNINSLLDTQEIPAYHALKLASEDLNIINYNKDNNLENLLKEISNYKNVKFTIPKHLESIMRPYQKEGFLWLKTLIKHNFSGILADDMGLGKTLEMISVIISDDTKAPSLIVTPKSLTYNWKHEFARWAPDYEVINIIGSSLERAEIISGIDQNDNKIYITSYDSLRNDIELYEKISFLYTVLDEGQYIKNHQTLKARSVKTINSKYRFAMTGTPIENSIMDLWSIFDFLMPGYLDNITKFRREYERAVVIEKDKRKINKLIQKVAPFILRRVKEDVMADLPAKINIVQVASMTPEQRKVYDAQLKYTRDILESSENKIELLACITRLRQTCVDPGMFLDNYTGGSGKVSLVLELIEEYIKLGHRIVLFSQFTSIFAQLETELSNKKIKYFILTGKTPAKRRVDMASEFNTNEEYKIFLVSLKAGGTGLNLIGADLVIHLDPWWNIAAENQATDRTHRIGQTKLVQVIKLISENSIEQKVLELQERKKEIAEMIVADDDTNIQKLSKEDLDYILN